MGQKYAANSCTNNLHKQVFGGDTGKHKYNVSSNLVFWVTFVVQKGNANLPY